jgi:type IV secretory pathway TrbD component
MRVLRWVICIPAGFLASLLLGAVVLTVANAVGGANWYVWMASGTVSAVAFFAVSLWLAPARTPALKWALVSIVAVLGAMALLGPILVRHEPIRAIAGVAMVFVAVAYSRMSVAQLQADIAGTTRIGTIDQPNATDH